MENTKRLGKKQRSEIRGTVRAAHHPGSAGLQRMSKLSLDKRAEAVKAEGAGRSHARAVAKHIRMSPRKARLVVDLIRGKAIDEARAILKFVNKRAAEPVVKVLESATANAINNYDMLEDELIVKAAFVDEGPSIKRMLPRARGRADMIKKRTSHITIIVGENNG
jgi:large subunit ribosomal protein L22